MTISLVVIMFELTGALTYTVPAMIVALITKTTGDLFYHGGIADQLSRLKGLPFLDKEERTIGIPISRVMTQNVVLLPSRGCSYRALGMSYHTAIRSTTCRSIAFGM